MVPELGSRVLSTRQQGHYPCPWSPFPRPHVTGCSSESSQKGSRILGCRPTHWDPGGGCLWRQLVPFTLAAELAPGVGCHLAPPGTG